MMARRVFHSEEERREARREAVYRYDHSEKGLASRRRAEASPLAPARYARYRATDKYQAVQARYHASPKWKATSQEASRRAREREPERIQARAAIAVAIKNGSIVRPDLCSRCSQAKRLHAHHHAGYEPTHWLDIAWLCVPCHKVVHR